MGGPLRRRVLLAFVSWALTAVLVAIMPAVMFCIVVAVAAALAALECARLLQPAERMLMACASSGAGLVVLAAAAGGWSPFVLTFACAVVAVLAVIVFRPCSSPHDSISNALATVFTIAYTGIPFALLCKLRALPAGLVAVSFVLTLTWARDVGAFFVGTLSSGHCIDSRISPRKTYEGALGGAGLVALLCTAFAMAGLPLTAISVVAYTVVVGTLGQAGDLFESLLKRHADVRDSGELFGRQGGVLDTVDAFLFTVPPLFVYITEYQLI